MMEDAPLRPGIIINATIIIITIIITNIIITIIIQIILLIIIQIIAGGSRSQHKHSRVTVTR